MVQVIVFYAINEIFVKQFTEAFRELQPLVLAEEGCLQYELFVSPYAPQRFCLVEKWTSQDALDVHLSTEHLSDFREESRYWFEKNPTIEIKEITHERYL